MYKSMIAPIVTILALGVSVLFGVEIPEALQTEVTNAIAVAIAVGVSVHGVFKSHDKDKNGLPKKK